MLEDNKRLANTHSNKIVFGFDFLIKHYLNFSWNILQQFLMSFLGNPDPFNNRPHLRTSDIQNYRPGEFLRRFDEQRESNVSYTIPTLNPPSQTIFKDSFIGGLNSYTDEFYKSQVMQRAIGGETIKLNTMDTYQPLSADDPFVMDQIRQEHLKIMDNKLKQAIEVNGGNALQQVKTIIVQPLADVVQIKQSNVIEGFHGVARKSAVSTAAMIPPHPSGRVSNVSIGAPILPNYGVQRRASQVSISQPAQQGHSRIEYVPFQRKVTDVQTRERIELVPRERVIIQYEQKKIIEQVPVQKTVLDYYTIEHVTQYQPQVIEQTIIQMVPVEKTYHNTCYVPIEQQIIHIPGQNGKQGQSRVLYQGPPTSEGTAALKGQSRITYQPPISRSNSIISYQNPLAAMQSVPIERKNSRTPSKMNRNNSSTNVSKRSVSPIHLRPPQQAYQQNNMEINNQGVRFYQQQSYANVSNPVLPFTNQLKQQQVRFVQEPLFPQYNQAQYIQPNNYPSPSQIQSFYQIPGGQSVDHSQSYQASGYSSQSNYNMGNFAYSQQPRPQEVRQENKVIRRQNSGISLTR